MVVRFPQELVDIVIDFLYDHKPSLCVCSLVCHDWLGSSRLHKFSSMLVDNYRLGSLDECPIAIPYVRRITLSLYSTPFPNVISKYANLRKFHLRGAEGSKIPNEPELCSALPFHRLTSLILTQCCFQSAHHFARFLLNFPHLDSLCLTRVGWQEESTAYCPDLLNSEAYSPPFAGQLYLQEVLPLLSYEKPIVTILTSLPTGSHFQSIKLTSNWWNNESLADWNALLVVCGPSLQRLDLRTANTRRSRKDAPYSIWLRIDFKTDPEPPNLLDFTQNVNLQELMTPDLPEYSDPELWLLPMLSTLRSRSLKRIEINASPLGVWKPNHWAGIDALFGNIDRFPHLQKFDVMLRCSNFTADSLRQDFSCAMLPLIQARGVLCWSPDSQ